MADENCAEPLTTQKRHCHYDDVFKHIRSFGRVQILLYLSMSFLVTLMAMQYGLLVFAMGPPRFYCADVNSTCPEDNVCCANCTTYAYEEGQFTSTVTEWDLLCDRAYLAATIQSCYFAGMFFGAITGGWLSDNFGRKPTMFIGVGVMALVSLGSSFSDAISLLSLLRFVIGFFQMVLNVTYFVYAIEILGPKYRTLGGQLCSLFWLFGYSTTAVFAFFIRDWRMLIVAVSIPGLLFVLLWKIFPASPRWLIAHNRLDEAHSILLKFGSRDSKPIDEQALRELIEDVRRDQLERHKMDDKRYTMMDLVRTPKLRKRSFILFYTWVVCAIVHFGFFLYVTSLTGNLYSNYVIMNVITFPKALGFIYVMNKFGRRIPYSACMFLSALFCLLILAIPKDYFLTITVFAMLGKSFMSAQFLNAFLYGTELFPTVVRSNAIGCGTMTSRLGGMLTPYIAMLGQLPNYGVYVPATIFGVLTLVGAIMSLWLPETLFAKLSQTVEEAEAAKEDFSIICWGHHKRRKREAEDLGDDYIKDTEI
ncbi:organic cation transporter protein isoform X1 [Nematostella vectensis]|uniref:organic cation transporter protein isoform X1 n=1 Tax=Nematostella vectensis TaxID=45351 RepID=UPI001390566F|nr:organic cation transporter protein isoform X1 [Nematostella vectensis]